MHALLGNFVTLALIGTLAPLAGADMVHFENTNTALDSLKMYSSAGFVGQSLDITNDAFHQPAHGENPASAIFFMESHGLGGDFVWLGMGWVTMIAKSTNETLIPDPWAGALISYHGPQDFEQGAQVNESANFNDGWRMMHGYNELTEELGIFTVEEHFTVGVMFQQDDGMHFGYAQLIRSIELNGNDRFIQWHPQRWGYETDPGVGVSVIPAPGALSCVMIGMAGCVTRRRR